LGQNHSKIPHSEIPYKNLLHLNFRLSRCSIAWAPPSSKLTPGFKQPAAAKSAEINRPPLPILNQINRQSQQLIGLSKPNLQSKFRARFTDTAGVAAQNACSCSQNVSRRIFTGQTKPPALTNHVAPEPANPKQPPSRTLKPYEVLYVRALAKPKRWQSIQPKPTYL